MIIREGYVLSYNNQLRVPNWVAYRLRPSALRAAVREDLGSFRSDPETAAPSPDEAWPAGYLPVRLVPREVMRREDPTREALAIEDADRMGNVAFLNERGLGSSDGLWQRLQIWIQERLVRQGQQEIGVIAGCVTGRALLQDSVAPMIFQVLYLPEQEEDPQALAFLLPQQDRVIGRIQDFIVPVEVVEALTGLQFFPLLPEGLRQRWTWNAELPRDSAAVARRSVTATPKPRPEGAKIGDEPPWVIVPLYYGTDRRVNRNGDVESSETIVGEEAIKQFFTGQQEAADIIHLGICRVSIPTRPDGKPRPRGEIPLPHWWEASDQQEHFMLYELQALDQAAFLARLEAEIARTKGRQAFVFIHGFNNSFASAAYRTAQMAFDLNVDCVPILYSWPSRGSPERYAADLEQVQDSLPRIKAFLRLVGRQTQAERIHLIAHSMGTRLLSTALAELADEDEKLPHINQIILAAPDIDAKEFVDNIAPRIENTGQRITIYQSQRDQALYVSQLLMHVTSIPRLGLRAIDLSRWPRFDQVDCTWVDDSTIGHMYVGGESEVLDDVRAVLSGEEIQRRTLQQSYMLPGDVEPWKPQFVMQTPWYYTWRLPAMFAAILLLVVWRRSRRRRARQEVS
jgi:esterase/lipase superfamily enzyme